MPATAGLATNFYPTDRVRVWTIGLKPGQRLGFHTHVLDYFWTSVTGG